MNPVSAPHEPLGMNTRSQRSRYEVLASKLSVQEDTMARTWNTGWLGRYMTLNARRIVPYPLLFLNTRGLSRPQGPEQFLRLSFSSRYKTPALSCSVTRLTDSSRGTLQA